MYNKPSIMLSKSTKSVNKNFSLAVSTPALMKAQEQESKKKEEAEAKRLANLQVRSAVSLTVGRKSTNTAAFKCSALHRSANNSKATTRTNAILN